MGSNLSCVKSKSGTASADNVYDEAFDNEDPTECNSPTDLVSQVSEPCSPSPPPSTTSRTHLHPSPNNNNNLKNNGKPFVHGVAVLPPNSKPTKPAPTKGDKSNTAIAHDENEYALPFPKHGNRNSDGGNSSNSSQTKEKTAKKVENKNGARVNCVVLPVDLKSADYSAPSKNGGDQNKCKPADTGAYCNVVLADVKETKSFSNELYDDPEPQAPRVPENTRSVNKISEGHQKSHNAQLNYIEIEFVNPTEETARSKVKRSPSPTHYTDVISENGVVRLVN
ncbi:hypothetical protein EGW08_021852 [Elysia chlorotica]|uniref:Uncharacterized protein n=1 Tax=Elysia chlorotica TaxID=188477 RepID=A0A3S1H1L7_ELYCH|nr:hypothetical protein EGW08_021852 [Elysia chlorotica]